MLSRTVLRIAAAAAAADADAARFRRRVLSGGPLGGDRAPLGLGGADRGGGADVFDGTVVLVFRLVLFFFLFVLLVF